MEIKKSTKADLDGKRMQGFLLGVILVLTMLFVALEYDWTTSSSDYDFDALENIVKELDLEALKEEERIPLIKEQVVERPQSADKLNVVEDEPEVELKDEIAPPEDVELKTVDEVENPEQPTVVDMELNPLNFRIVEELPEFPGGATAFMKWLTKNLRYPSIAQQRKVEGKVVAQFIVNTDGSISNIELVTRVDPNLDREALRVLRMMPQWKAGKQNDKPCRTQVCIPIVFKL
ncbi:MAG: energy transducer TonB [Prevotella sp.]|jgi:protein TonB|nr:energy transducer TonB [Prevotella sp.]MBR6828335.1 energy transducer TonB [Prevotella sp.]